MSQDLRLALLVKSTKTLCTQIIEDFTDQQLELELILKQNGKIILKLKAKAV